MTSNPWRKASRSGNTGGDCLELHTIEVGLIRDSKNPDGPALNLGRPKLAALLHEVRTGGYDRWRGQAGRPSPTRAFR